MTGLEIVGADECAEDSQGQYRAMAVYDNNSTLDVTASAQWSVEPNDDCSIAAGLLVTEVIDVPTDVTISAQYSEGENTQEAEKDVSIFAICPSGSALEFDGVDDYVKTVPLNIDIVTVATWVKVAGGDRGDIISNHELGGYGLISQEGKIRYSVHINGAYRGAISDTSILQNQWYHIAATYDGDNGYLYINGVKEPDSFGDDGPITDTIVPLIIGGNPLGGGGVDSPFDGTIDDVCIYDRALSAEEIQGLMHTKLAGDEPNLVGYWDFDEGEGQVAGDSSGNGTDGQLGSELDIDGSDPKWVESEAPIGICTAKGLVERNLSRVFDMKETILEILEDAIATEDATKEFLDELFKSGEIGDLKKGDVVKAKQKIHSAIQHEEQAEASVDQSIDKLDDALNTLGIE